MELISTILIWVNLVLAVSCMVHFFRGARKSNIMRPVLLMLGWNCLIMIGLYVSLLFNVTLPEITGRVNLTLVLLSLNVAGLLLNGRYK